VDAALKSNASLNEITNPGTGSPNALLNVSFIGGGPPGNQAPHADFTINCQTDATSSQCTLDASASTDDGGFGNLTAGWTNDAGRPAKTGNPVVFKHVTWPYPNTFNVTLTVRDGGGLTHSVTRQVVIPPPSSSPPPPPPPGNQPPVADFTITCQTASAKHSCTVDAGPSTDDGGFGNLSFVWTTDVGRPSKTGATATYVYVTWPYPNTFNVTLTATDAGGLTSTITKLVSIP
jgi:hypothetical protein